jgi:uncharacterized glyoxalase superfamily protein PhnB
VLHAELRLGDAVVMLATADADYTVPTLVGRSTGGGLYLLVEDVGDLRCGDRGRRDGGARAGNSRTGHRASPLLDPEGHEWSFGTYEPGGSW